MVLGIGKGKIEIRLNKLKYSQGETISGIISIHMKEPTYAKSMKVSLIGEKKTSGMNLAPNSIKAKSATKQIFNQETPLGGEGNYSNHEVPFTIQIPNDILKSPVLGGTAGKVLKGIQFLTTGSSKTVWYVKAWLDIPKGFDVSKKVEVDIT